MHMEGLALILSETQRGHAMFVALQECMFIALFVLVASFLVLARHGHSEGKRRAILTIAELVSVTSALQPEDLESINAFPLVRGILLGKPRMVRLSWLSALLELFVGRDSSGTKRTRLAAGCTTYCDHPC
jgi:hypothetical protein